MSARASGAKVACGNPTLSSSVLSVVTGFPFGKARIASRASLATRAEYVTRLCRSSFVLSASDVKKLGCATRMRLWFFDSVAVSPRGEALEEKTQSAQVAHVDQMRVVDDRRERFARSANQQQSASVVDALCGLHEALLTREALAIRVLPADLTSYAPTTFLS